MYVETSGKGIRTKAIIQNASVTYLTILSANVLIRLEKQYSNLPSASAVIETEPVDCLKCLASARLWGSASCGSLRRHVRRRESVVCHVPRSQCPNARLLLLGMLLSSRQLHEVRVPAPKSTPRTLSFCFKSSKKHSFCEAATSIM